MRSSSRVMFAGVAALLLSARSSEAGGSGGDGESDGDRTSGGIGELDRGSGGDGESEGGRTSGCVGALDRGAGNRSSNLVSNRASVASATTRLPRLTTHTDIGIAAHVVPAFTGLADDDASAGPLVRRTASSSLSAGRHVEAPASIACDPANAMAQTLRKWSGIARFRFLGGCRMLLRACGRCARACP